MPPGAFYFPTPLSAMTRSARPSGIEPAGSSAGGQESWGQRHFRMVLFERGFARFGHLSTAAGAAVHSSEELKLS